MDGDLRWRNGEAFSGADAEVDDALTWTQVFWNFTKAMLVSFVGQIVAIVLIGGLVVFAWFSGWFG